MKSTVTELIPSCSQKSFYGKAKVVDDGIGSKYLLSYSTIVASVDAYGKVRRHSDWRTNTTSRHVDSFLKQFSSDVKTVKDFWKLPVAYRNPVKVEL